MYNRSQTWTRILTRERQGTSEEYLTQQEPQLCWLNSPTLDPEMPWNYFQYELKMAGELGGKNKQYWQIASYSIGFLVLSQGHYLNLKLSPPFPSIQSFFLLCLVYSVLQEQNSKTGNTESGFFYLKTCCPTTRAFHYLNFQVVSDSWVKVWVL